MNAEHLSPETVVGERAAYAAWAERQGINLAKDNEVADYEYAVARFSWRSWLARAAAAHALENLVHNAWRDAVLDHAASTFVGTDGTPHEVLRRIIATSVAIALDPLVSEDAQALVEKGAALERAAHAAKMPALLANSH